MEGKKKSFQKIKPEIPRLHGAKGAGTREPGERPTKETYTWNTKVANGGKERGGTSKRREGGEDPEPTGDAFAYLEAADKAGGIKPTGTRGDKAGQVREWSTEGTGSLRNQRTGSVKPKQEEEG